MRILMTIILATASCFLSKAQVWAPPGATWHYVFASFNATGYVKIKYIGDTIVGGKPCKVLEKIRYTYNFSFGLDTTFIGSAFTYLENDTLYHYRNDQFYILYDFSASAGDIWQVAETDTNCGPDSLAKVRVVDGLSTTNINGFTLATITVTPDSPTYFGYYGEIVERIGCLDSYMFPEYVACLFDANQGGNFRCYYDDSFGFYQRSVSACDYIPFVGISNLTSSNDRVDIYPNPTTSEIVIEFKDKFEDQITITLYSVLGHVEKTFEFANIREGALYIRDLPQGIYFVRITDTKGGYLTKKIIKK